jgi:hypothetical protein
MKFDRNCILTLLGLLLMSQSSVNGGSLIGELEGAVEGDTTATTSEATGSEATTASKASTGARPGETVPRAPGVAALTKGAQGGASSGTTATSSAVSDLGGGASSEAGGASTEVTAAGASRDPTVASSSEAGAQRAGSSADPTVGKTTSGAGDASAGSEGDAAGGIKEAVPPDIEDDQPKQALGRRVLAKALDGAGSALKVFFAGALFAGSFFLIQALFNKITQKGSNNSTVPTNATATNPVVAIFNSGTQAYLRACVSCQTDGSVPGVAVRADGTSTDDPTSQWIILPIPNSQNSVAFQNVATQKFIGQCSACNSTVNGIQGGFSAETIFNKAEIIPNEAQFQVQTQSTAQTNKGTTYSIFKFTSATSQGLLEVQQTNPTHQNVYLSGTDSTSRLAQWSTIVVNAVNTTTTGQ